jgi:hypothetical protein
MQIDLLHNQPPPHPTPKTIALFLLFRFFFFFFFLLLLLQAILVLKFSSQKNDNSNKNLPSATNSKNKTNPPTKDVKPQNEEHLCLLLLSNCRKSLGKKFSIYQSILLLLLLRLSTTITTTTTTPSSSQIKSKSRKEQFCQPPLQSANWQNIFSWSSERLLRRNDISSSSSSA